MGKPYCLHYHVLFTIHLDVFGGNIRLKTLELVEKQSQCMSLWILPFPFQPLSSHQRHCRCVKITYSFSECSTMHHNSPCLHHKTYTQINFNADIKTSSNSTYQRKHFRKHYTEALHMFLKDNWDTAIWQGTKMHLLSCTIKGFSSVRAVTAQLLLHNDCCWC